VQIRQDGADRVAVGGVRGRARPDRLKVTVAFDGGLLAEAGVSYAGPGAKARAELAGAIIRERMLALHGCNAPLRIDLIGVNAIHGTALEYPSDAQDVRMRAALRADSRGQAELLLWEVESLLCCGPAGGGGYRGRITPSVITHSAYIDRAQVQARIEIIET
jgi:Acyclic terpene utilisation family protein AtuA